MRVAIKKGYLKSQSTYGVSSTFIREIGILKELSLYHHMNIVEVCFCYVLLCIFSWSTFFQVMGVCTLWKSSILHIFNNT